MATPYPKPQAIKKLQGNAGKRPLNEEIPNNQQLQLQPPDTLDEVGKQFYKDVLAYWGVCRVVQQQDYFALAVAASDWSEFTACSKFIAQNGYSYEVVTREGEATHRAYPQVAIRADANKRLKTFFQSFGMTPSSLSRVKATEASNGESPLDQLANLRLAKKRANVNA